MTTVVPVNKLRSMLLAMRQLTQDTERILSGYKAIQRAVAANDAVAERTFDGTHGNSDLTPVEQAANRNLGDLNAAGDTYKPGPLLQAERIVHLVKTISAHAHELITIADSTDRPLADIRQRCIGTGDAKGSTCTQWRDPDRNDGRCIDCRRAVRAAYKRKYERQRYASSENPT